MIIEVLISKKKNMTSRIMLILLYCIDITMLIITPNDYIHPVFSFLNGMFIVLIYHYCYYGFKHWNIVRKITYILYIFLGLTIEINNQTLISHRSFIFYACLIAFILANDNWWNKRKSKAKSLKLKVRQFLAQGVPA